MAPRSPSGSEVFPTLPPYSVPLADMDLLSAGVVITEERLRLARAANIKGRVLNVGLDAHHAAALRVLQSRAPLEEHVHRFLGLSSGQQRGAGWMFPYSLRWATGARLVDGAEICVHRANRAQFQRAAGSLHASFDVVVRVAIMEEYGQFTGDAASPADIVDVMRPRALAWHERIAFGKAFSLDGVRWIKRDDGVLIPAEYEEWVPAPPRSRSVDAMVEWCASIKRDHRESMQRFGYNKTHVEDDDVIWWATGLAVTNFNRWMVGEIPTTAPADNIPWANSQVTKPPMSMGQ